MTKSRTQPFTVIFDADGHWRFAAEPQGQPGEVKQLDTGEWQATVRAKSPRRAAIVAWQLIRKETT